MEGLNDTRTLIHYYRYLSSLPMRRYIRDGLKTPNVKVLYKLPSPINTLMVMRFKNLSDATKFDVVVKPHKWVWKGLSGKIKKTKKKKRNPPKSIAKYDVWYMSANGHLARKRVSAGNPRAARAKLKALMKGKPFRIIESVKAEEYMKVKRNPLCANPPQGSVRIYEKILAIEAIKGNESLWPKEKFRHDFKQASAAEIFGLPDGSLLIKSKKGKKLWKDFDYPDR